MGLPYAKLNSENTGGKKSETASMVWSQGRRTNENRSNILTQEIRTIRKRNIDEAGKRLHVPEPAAAGRGGGTSWPTVEPDGLSPGPAMAR
jgi:hypothetical protein